MTPKGVVGFWLGFLPYYFDATCWGRQSGILAPLSALCFPSGPFWPSTLAPQNRAL
jgi:hypothetical protein